MSRAGTAGVSATMTLGAGSGRLLSPAGDVAYARRMEPAVADSELMQRYGEGDVAAFEMLYRRHNDALYRYLLRLAKNPDTAADVFQEVWSNIIRSRRRYRPTARFNTFLYRVAHNCFIDHLRRTKRHAAPVAADPDDLAHPAEPPEAQAEMSLARERIRIAVEALPEEQRNAFLLREEAGLTIEGIAEVTGVNRETAKSRLRYAMQKLKSALRDDYADRVEAS